MKKLFSFLRPRTRPRDRESDGADKRASPGPPDPYEGKPVFLLCLHDRLLAEHYKALLTERFPDFRVLRSDSPEQTAALCRETHPAALLMEVLAYQPWKFAERQALCETVRGLSPGCKLLFLVDEQRDKVLARQVTTCKREGLIDEFIFRSISDSYFADLLDVLCGEVTP